MKKKYIKTSINSGDCLRVSKMLSKNTEQQLTFITPEPRNNSRIGASPISGAKKITSALDKIDSSIKQRS